VFIRAPWVEEVGPGVQVCARVEWSHARTPRSGDAATDGPAAGKIVAVRQGALLATSFHPEVTGDTRVHELFVKMCKDGQ
jgi:5'-phosphate synthase pdxT subunit